MADLRVHVAPAASVNPGWTNRYAIGTVLRLSLIFTNGVDVNGQDIYVDPTTVVIKTAVPVGTITTHTYGSGSDRPIKTATGRYYLDVTLNTEGVWRWRAESAGTNVAAPEEGQLVVPDSAFY